MTAATVERKYQMTRVAAGDYLLPSNDGTVLWRIHSYEEDGSLGECDRNYNLVRSIIGTFWSASRYRQPISEISDETLVEDFLDWERWREEATTLSTRREAIEYALGR